MIQCHDIRFERAQRTILDGVSLSADASEVVVVVGPNGAGKSSLFRILAGDERPTSGAVSLLGRDVASAPPMELARLRAVMPQESTLAFPFTVHEVVMLGRTPFEHRGEPMACRAVARAAMSATDTLRLEDRLFSTLSGGERQRVVAARVLAQIWEGAPGRALLLDEPTSALDLLHQHALLETAVRMADRGCAIVCILHDLNLAARYATRIVVLDGGRVVATGSPRDVLTRELVADVFEVEADVVFAPRSTSPTVVSLGPRRRECERLLPKGTLL